MWLIECYKEPWLPYAFETTVDWEWGLSQTKCKAGRNSDATWKW